MKIVVLHGAVPSDAPPDEQDVLIQAETVTSALKNQGHDPERLVFSSNLPEVASRLRDLRPDLAFNLVESVEGKDRLAYLAPALLDSLGIRYTGCSAEAVFLTSGKLLTKRVMKLAGIPTPQWITPDSAVEEMEAPWIIKPVWEHASIGLDQSKIVPSSTAALESLKTSDGGSRNFAEQFIDGREFNLSLLGFRRQPELLPAAEMRFVDFPEGKYKIVDYRAKWDESSFEYRNTVRAFDFPPEDQALLNRLALLASQCWTVFELSGYARVDFRVDKNGEPWVLEINANPCISPDAGLMAAARQAGYDYGDVIARIVAEVS